MAAMKAVNEEAYLVGRLVTEEHWNPWDLIEAIKKEWKPKHGMSSRVLEESKLILFSFENVKDRDSVLGLQPWKFRGSLFAITKINEQQLFSSGNVTVDYASFWARLYNVPFSRANKTSLTHFAKQVGVLEDVGICISGEDSFGKYMRFKICIDITKPLVRGITIWFKGNSLWLPLKYESLPIFCYICCTIGHHYRTCHSSLKLIAPPNPEEALPHDIVEIILSRLPVKCLFRFKVVSKKWEATISDPRFADIHLQRYKNSTSRTLLACEVSIPRRLSVVPRLHNYMRGCDPSEFIVAQVVGHNVRAVSTIETSWKCLLRPGFILGNCDGLYLMRCFDNHPRINMFVVWNPSCRAYREIWCPQPIGYNYALYGIYYNPMMKDYRVLIGGRKHYAVFSCGSNEWGEVKETKGISWNYGELIDEGVSCKGSLYWLHHLSRGGFEIICFDWKDEKFKKVPAPDCKGDDLRLTSSPGHLCLWYKPCPDEIKIMKKDDKDSWMEIKVKLQAELLPGPHRLYWVSEDEILLYTFNIPGLIFIIYDLSKTTFTRVMNIDPFRPFDQPLPYLENLFLQ